MEKTLKLIEKDIEAKLDHKDKMREKVMPACREVVRMASGIIKEVHRHNWENAKNDLRKAAKSIQEIQKILAKEPDLRHAGFVTMAEKEYAEAAITLAILGDKRLPTPEELTVPAPEYLNGMAEAIGEMRRHLLDRLRKQEFAEAERILSTMDSFYYFLFSLDYPDAILRGLRRMVDNDRGIIERSRGDLTSALIQENLRRELLRVENKIGKKNGPEKSAAKS
ncbi:MAG: haloacid dehalogenase [Candidatus Ratteibacteria bacterium]|jgi:translin